MIEFHTPELPTPLGLDLAKLEGGGSCPTQFFGETHDGLDFYVRYRGGALTVYLGHKPGDDAITNGKLLIEADIGPYLDGSMSITQFCTHFGVTINGFIPAETDPEIERYNDFTGKTTYWGAHLATITIETARSIVRDACTVFPNAILVKPRFNDNFSLDQLEPTTPQGVDTSLAWLIDGPSHAGEIEISDTKRLLLRPKDFLISMSFSAWEFEKPMFSGFLTQFAEEKLHRRFFVPGLRDAEIEHKITTDMLNLRASFSTADKITWDKLTKLSRLIEQRIPMTALEIVDLASGNPIGVVNRPLDPAIANWCASNHDRWVEISSDSGTGDWIGMRPATR